MNLRIVALLILVTAFASLTQSSILLDSEPVESPQDDDVTVEADAPLSCEDDPSLCPKTRGISGIVGAALGFGDIVKAAVKSGVGIVKNIVGIPDDPEIVNVYVPPQNPQILVPPPGVIIG
ncbi:uncharacterized protein [Diabrotica undecimpunctata]|uniref:uncharacterized protein n=1 Tax=Diabrotica undecimpunctata TaxID=50387 RepID=UPI003B638838